jgi:hypothetical protein
MVARKIHTQWRIAEGKSKDDKDSNDKDKIALVAANKTKGGKNFVGDDKLKTENTNKDKICNHCKKKGHIENACWKK